MNVFLTGGTGFVGSAVLRHLLSAGHEVTALVRSQESATAVSEEGARAVLGDVTDVSWLTQQIASTDGAIHAASPGNADSPAVDIAVATAVNEAYAGTGRPYLHTGGIWVYGSNPAITEDSPWNPPAITAWRADVEKLALGGEDVRGVIVVPAVVYGHGKGIPSLLTGAPRDDDGSLHLVGDGTQHWTLVDVEDLADLYVLALENTSASGYYVVAGDASPTVRELAEATGSPVVPETPDQSRERFGALFADALLLDQQSAATRARTELGWQPKAIPLVDDIAHGSYSS